MLVKELGANVNATDGCGRTALHAAAFVGDHEGALVLMRLGADVGATDNDGCTSLHIAARNDFEKVVHFLLSYGSDVNAVFEDSHSPAHIRRGVTPLHLAAQNGYPVATRLLAHFGADVGATLDDGSTPLLLSARNDGGAHRRETPASRLLTNEIGADERGRAGEAPPNSSYSRAVWPSRNSPPRLFIGAGS